MKFLFVLSPLDTLNSPFSNMLPQVPSIKPDEILVKITSASLCHSDLMLFETNEQGLKLGEGDPFTMVSKSVLRDTARH